MARLACESPRCDCDALQKEYELRLCIVAFPFEGTRLDLVASVQLQMRLSLRDSTKENEK